MRLLNYLFLIAFTFITYSQNSNSDSVFINKIYDEALSNGESYEWLDYHLQSGLLQDQQPSYVTFFYCTYEEIKKNIDDPDKPRGASIE